MKLWPTVSDDTLADAQSETFGRRLTSPESLIPVLAREGCAALSRDP